MLGFCWKCLSGSISQRSRLGLDFQPLSSYTCTEMSVPERQGYIHIPPRTFYTDCNQICSYNRLSGTLSKAGRAVTRLSCQELSLCSFSYCPGIVFGTEKITAIRRVFPVATGDIQTLCFSTASFALSLCPMLCLLLVLSVQPQGTTQKQINLCKPHFAGSSK